MKPIDTSVLDFEWPSTHSTIVPSWSTQTAWINGARCAVQRNAAAKAAAVARPKAEALRLQRELASGVLDSSWRSARYRELVQGSGALSIGILELEACNAHAEVMDVHARLATRILSVKIKPAAAQRKIASAAKGFDSAHAAFHELWSQAKSTLGVDSPYLACLSRCKVDEAALHKDELQDRRTFEPIIARMLNDSANAAKPLPAQRAASDVQLKACVCRIANIRKRTREYARHITIYKGKIAATSSQKIKSSLQRTVQLFESQMAADEAALLKVQTQESELSDAVKAAKACVRSRFERLACRERGVAALLAKIRALVDGVARMAAERASLSATSRPSKRARRSARAAESAAAVKDGDSDGADASSSSSSFSSSSDEEGLEAIYSSSGVPPRYR